MKLLLALALCVSPVFAAPATQEQRTLIAHMVNECRSVMGQAVCRVENNDRVNCASAKDQMACRLLAFNTRYPNGLFVLGAGMFTAAEYFQYVDAGKRMCEVVVENCSRDYDGRGCMMARALWRQR